MKQDVVLEGIQADDQIGLESTLCLELLLEALNLLVILINDFCATPAQNLSTIGNASRNPAIKQMTATSQLSSLDNDSLLTLTSSNKQDQTTTLSDTTDDSTCSSQVGGGLVKRDDVNTLADTKDVASIGGVPERSRVTQMGLRGKKELERDFIRRRRLGELLVRLVLGSDDDGSNTVGDFLVMLESGVVTSDLVTIDGRLNARGERVRGGINRLCVLQASG